jgi:ferredoxin
MSPATDKSSDFAVVIDTDLCSGQGRCYSLAPDVFGADESGFGVVKVDTVPASERSMLERVVQLCPELAIRIEERPAGGTPAET